ncbi:MAG: lytic transglycosylase domain-containing protein [Candidatus Latescibacterota bacterium]|nr:MAG: lytic transglycosylase domain-containing protein [Candidatus Latescibacterota bacterium]
MRRYEEAFDALPPGSDSLRAGITASLAGRHEDAVALLRRPSSNPYIERFRLYHVSRSLLGAGRCGEAYDALRNLPYPEGTQREHSDRFHARSRELAASILAECDSLLSVEGIPPDAAKMPAKTRYALGRALLRTGRDSLGAAEIRGACAARWEPEDREILEEALSACEAYYGDMSPADLRDAALGALSAKLSGAARRIVEHLLDRNPRDYETMLIKVRLLEMEEHNRDASALCGRILASGASGAVKKRAHARLPYIEYDLGHRERAADLCREHADRFGDKGLLAFGARIDVSLGRLARAFDAFRELAGAGPAAVDLEHLRAVGALGCVLGRREEAYRRIEDRLSPLVPKGERYEDGGRGASPSMLYWLWRTAPDPAVKERILSALLRSHPDSPYADAARGALDSVFALMRAEPAGDLVVRMAAKERGLVDSLASARGSDCALAGNAAFAACRYFLDCGLPSEAAECAAALGRDRDARQAAAVAVYREARNRGYYRLAMRMIDALPGHDFDAETARRLRHPVAFSGVVASAAYPGIPAELVLAVMREESAFDPSAASRAGAIGLMQLMPATARWIARERGWRDEHCGELRDPACNVAMGSRYLSYLLDRFDGSIVAALAAYNGGEGRMSRWRKQFDPAGDPMAAMELIGPRETRGYVAKVLDSLWFYRTSAGEGEAGER